MESYQPPNIFSAGDGSGMVNFQHDNPETSSASLSQITEAGSTTHNTTQVDDDPMGAPTIVAMTTTVADLPLPIPAQQSSSVAPPPVSDVLQSIRGLYRILDLISEQSSGGLVDKVIIDQQSLGCLINDLSPGAYASMTKVNFAALDQMSIKPIGIYGSKDEIIRFLLSLQVIDATIATILRKPEGTRSGTSTLRSGLYILRLSSEQPMYEDDVVYAIYWPEDTTWDDNAVSAVRRNRITFMRYLTKLTDQVIAFISDEHAESIIFKEQMPDEDMEIDDDDDDDDDDRLFAFEVSKTNEQEESVTLRQGFELQDLRLGIINSSDIPTNLDPSLLKPRLIYGEVTQGVLTPHFKAAFNERRDLDDTCNSLRLGLLIREHSITLDDSISEHGIRVLINNGLKNQAPEACKVFVDGLAASQQRATAQSQQVEKDMRETLRTESMTTADAIRRRLAAEVLKTFTTLDFENIVGNIESEDDLDQSKERIAKLTMLYGPSIEFEILKICEDPKLCSIKNFKFKSLKERILLLDQVFQQHHITDLFKRRELVSSVIESGHIKPMASIIGNSSKPKPWYSRVVGFIGQDSSDSALEKLKDDVSQISDADFLRDLPEIAAREPILGEHMDLVRKFAHEDLGRVVSAKVEQLTAHIKRIQLEACRKQIQMSVDSQKAKDDRTHCLELVGALARNACDASRNVARIQSVEELSRSHWGSSTTSVTYRIRGYTERKTEPSIQYQILTLSLTEGDKHASQLDPTFVPRPRIHTGATSTFHLTLEQRIIHIQLLNDQKCLVIIEDANGNIRVFLELPSSLEGAIHRPSPAAKKILRRDKIGHQSLLAFDETKRMLAVCSTSKDHLQLHMFSFDEQYTSLQGWGNAINLGPWYDGMTSITHMAFVCASEELVLIDDTARIRIFSLVTQQFRPATIQLQRVPTLIYSSPDSSCLLTITNSDDNAVMQAFHWTTFGSGEGILLDLGHFSCINVSITSLVKRSQVHLVTLDCDTCLCCSIALDITRRVTEFTFKEKGTHVSQLDSNASTAHNCLVDCHADVWTRFPVIPAVRRQTITNSMRQAHTILFVTSLRHAPFASHFQDLISTFERTTRKPTGNELSSIIITVQNFPSFISRSHWQISSFRAGEWLVDLLCLIPIHIAITRDNRFVPLKDGVWSTDVEKALLGADVSRIVDYLSFGWYESLFQSYMALKPVKVVSSMGEQSVGKSFALNHLVDTSFAGSAMRTTEGVWMSVTPTDSETIVALDFEGVHSIERSAQEDTLLVLFNTAISNLVLFRNNFALSRDITGLFQSFQSSSSVLDPAANPTLFQSTLVIIIKDVIDSDKTEIKREFSLKFEQIVQLEQGSNFITRLHGGRLNIVPWPVIESRQFYTLFSVLKNRLDKQPSTYDSGTVFLQTLKTLMAKLKANDWGSISQNLALHRAQLLQSLLPTALMWGSTEAPPEFEHLKNFDTNDIIDKPDTDSQFFLSDASSDMNQLSDNSEGDRSKMLLAKLRNNWSSYGLRHQLQDEDTWFQELNQYLEYIVQLRIDHVTEWLSTNIARFPAAHAELEALRRRFNGLSIDMKAHVQLCVMKCSSCYQLCLLARHHEGSHDCCDTSHRCVRVCAFDHNSYTSEIEQCGLPAGHPGEHICDITVHLCGQPCGHSDKRGCMKECVKMVNHDEEEHVCSATMHECGEPCSLTNVKLPGGHQYSCSETCHVPSHEPHEIHCCANRQCPLPCQLCKRLCIDQNHLHGIEASATHLCGQEHSCQGLCSAQGICQIDTAPQSVDATFTGRHESFQYTKYSQVSRRLPCVVPIDRGEIMHGGNHTHSNKANPFHYCEARCENCGYLCTLPFGHPQQEHETSHGSMSKTQWAIDGPDGTIVELDGRKFGTNDDGAPMLCSLVCRSMGRHPHLAFCRTQSGDKCEGAEIQHIDARMNPEPTKPKDWISHSLHWRRTGFKDPYSHDDQIEFAKCDAMCGGPEHTATAHGPAQPSYCTMPIFHPHQSLNQMPPGGIGYISNDGHTFACRNPIVMQQAFHVIFVVDRSGSMNGRDRRPLGGTPVTTRIARVANNRLGAVYSSLYAFWVSRNSAANAQGNAQVVRRDAYTVLLFDHEMVEAVSNDFNSSADDLLSAVLRYGAGGGTDFTLALRTAQAAMQSHWSTERIPVVIFLSDGECSVADETMQGICRQAVTLGKPLSFHAVSFGTDQRGGTLRRMAQIAQDVQNSAPPDPMNPIVPSSYTTALDTVGLAETFLGIAESLRKPRGALMRAV